MSEIPSDVMKSVREALDFDRWAYEDSKDYDAAYQAVARLVLAERERCKAAINETIRLGMEAILAEFSEPSDETVETVARAIDRLAWETPDPEYDYPAERARREAKKQTSLQQARAAIKAMRSVI